MRRLWRPWTVLIQRESTYRLIFRALSNSSKENALSEKERRKAFGIGVSMSLLYISMRPFFTILVEMRGSRNGTQLKTVVRPSNC